MAWSDKIFAYCERAQDPSFWAEPFNALSNAAFILAAIAAAFCYARKDEPDRPVLALIVLVAIIGVGSFLFHTYATRWAAIADLAPIGIFMLAYLGITLRRIFGLNMLLIGVLLVGYVAALYVSGEIKCGPELLPITAAAGRACLNGTLGYAPALVALLLVAVALWSARHPAAGLVWLSTGVFALSMMMRSLDIEVCAATELLGRARGTHAIWHILNATLLYILLRAAILYSVPIRSRTQKMA